MRFIWNILWKELKDESGEEEGETKGEGNVSLWSLLPANAFGYKTGWTNTKMEEEIKYSLLLDSNIFFICFLVNSNFEH